MNRSFATIFLLFLITICLTFFVASCSDLTKYDEQSVNKELADSLIGMTISKGVLVDIIVDGTLKVRVNSPETKTVETEFASYTRFIGPPVDVTIYDSTGTVETTVRSQDLIYKSYVSTFEFEGDVFVEAKDDRTLRSEQLEWNESTRTISSPGFVIITSPTDSITGYGFVGDEDLIRYTLNRVTGEFSIN